MSTVLWSKFARKYQKGVAFVDVLCYTLIIPFCAVSQFEVHKMSFKTLHFEDNYDFPLFFKEVSFREANLEFCEPSPGGGN